MAEQVVNKRAREAKEQAGGAPSKALRAELVASAELSDAMEEVTEHHHVECTETVKRELNEVRALLTELVYSAPSGSHVPALAELSQRIRSTVQSVGTCLSTALGSLQELRLKQSEDVRRVLWGEFAAESDDKRVIRLRRLVKLWSGQRVHVVVTAPGRIYDICERSSGKQMAMVTQDGKLSRFGKDLVDFSAPFSTWKITELLAPLL